MSDAHSTGPVSLADEDATKAVLERTVLALWEVVNNLTRLRPSKRERFRVTIFGSARARPGSFAYDETRRLAAALAALDCEIVTGGGPGLMRAANEGATDAGARASVGIRVHLPFEQEANAFVTQVYEHRTFFTRLHHFVLASDAFVVAPGGIGTVLEAMLVWQLLQVGQLSRDVPLVFVGRMWRGLLDWARASMIGGAVDLVSTGDVDIPRCVDDADDAIAILRAAHERWRENDALRTHAPATRARAPSTRAAGTRSSASEAATRRRGGGGGRTRRRGSAR
jgi:uncharacterized protein (TIGR00730 family)